MEEEVAESEDRKRQIQFCVGFLRMSVGGSPDIREFSCRGLVDPSVDIQDLWTRNFEISKSSVRVSSRVPTGSFVWPTSFVYKGREQIRRFESAMLESDHSAQIFEDKPPRRVGQLLCACLIIRVL